MKQTDQQKREHVRELTKQITKLSLERARLQRELDFGDVVEFKAPRYDKVFFDGVKWLDEQ